MSNVTFAGGAENFVFYGDSTAVTDTDLFSGFKDALPGDTLTSEITIKNTAPEYDSVKIYLRANPHDEETNPLSPEVAEHETVASMTDFLSQLTLKVSNNGQIIYESTPDQPSTLTDYFLLGEFAPGEGTTLTAELSVPLELDNTYAHRLGEVDWVFLAEETSTETTETATNPDTGLLTTAPSYLAPTIALTAVLAFIITIAYISHKNNRNNKR